MTSNFFVHPSLVLIIGALILPFVQKGPLRKVFLVAVPFIAFLFVHYIEAGTYATMQFMDWQLTFGQVDSLSSVFAYIMTLMCIIGTIYGLHVEEDVQHIAA